MKINVLLCVKNKLTPFGFSVQIKSYIIILFYIYIRIK